MSVRFVRGGGINVDVAAISLAASGVIKVGQPVDFVRSGTGGAVVAPTTSSSTTTMVFGLAATYVQGASDTYVDVYPFVKGQLVEVDCANAATTAQLGLRHAWSASDRGTVHNTASDVSTQTGIFTALAMTGASTGSGKLIGYFNVNHQLIPVTDTTFLQ